jgi:DisA bacterial checkpoint controller nucleotide-binding
MVDTHNKTSLRIIRLRQELQDEVGLALPDEALEELAYARYAEPHEGMRAAYGAMIWNRELAAELHGIPELPSPAGFIDSQAPLDVMRTFSDGRTSFLTRGPGVTPAVAIDPGWNGSESSLSRYSTRSDVTVVQRLPSGRIRIYADGFVYSEDSGVWWTRPNAQAYTAQIRNVIDDDDLEAAGHILDLCIHTLSPAGHGATLVWFRDSTQDIHAHLDLSVALQPPALSATDPSHWPAISHALGQMDRAALVDKRGCLTDLNVTLTCADKHKTLSVPGGTRHNSAARYSASQEHAVVFIVSADGPVTVLHRGKVLATSRSGN